jgi:hypothetical protein
MVVTGYGTLGDPELIGTSRQSRIHKLMITVVGCGDTDPAS